MHAQACLVSSCMNIQACMPSTYTHIHNIYACPEYECLTACMCVLNTRMDMHAMHAHACICMPCTRMLPYACHAHACLHVCKSETYFYVLPSLSNTGQQICTWVHACMEDGKFAHACMPVWRTANLHRRACLYGGRQLCTGVHAYRQYPEIVLFSIILVGVKSVLTLSRLHHNEFIPSSPDAGHPLHRDTPQ